MIKVTSFVTLVLAPLTLMVSGCTTKPVKLVTVEVAVPVACKASKPTRPVMPTEALKAKPTTHEIVRAALAEIEIREGYETLLVTALDECLASPSPIERK